MRLPGLLAILLAAADPLGVSAATAGRSAPLIIDHNAVALYDSIPPEVIDQVKGMWFNMAGESHSGAYLIGCQLLQAADDRFQARVTASGVMEGATTQHLRVSRATWGDVATSGRWVHWYGEEDWFTSAQAVAATRQHVDYCNANGFGLTAIGFGWCRDMTRNTGRGTADPVHRVRWAGSSIGSPEGNRPWGLDAEDTALTGNSVCVDAYLQATQSLIDYCRSSGYPTTVLFTTGPVDGWDNTLEGGAQREIKHERIRQYVRNSTDAVLFDYADILCWSDAGDLKTISWTGWGRTHVYPFIHPENLLDLNGTYVEDGDHIGQRGTLRLAKAMWYTLARLSGWDPNVPTDPEPPAIFEQPASQSVNAGSNVSFSVGAEGTPPLQYQWYKETVSIETATTSTLTITEAAAADSGTYTVTVANDAGAVTSSAASLIVVTSQPPEITAQPQSQTVAAGATVTFSVDATGSAPLSYEWFMNGAALPNAFSPSLILAVVQAEDSGNYTVVVSNAAGTVTSSLAGLTVLAPPVSNDGPLIIDHNAVALYATIPPEVIDQVKGMWFNMPGGARGRAYGIGASLLQGLDPRFRVAVVASGQPEPYSADHLRISQVTWGNLTTPDRWRYGYGVDAWFTSPLSLQTTQRHIRYCNTNGLAIAAIGFDWGSEMTQNTGVGTADPVHRVRWAGSSAGSPGGSRPWGLDAEDTALTGNSVCMDTYLQATQSLIDYCRSSGFPTTVLFTTGPVDGWDNTLEGGAQREIKHERIRQHVRNSTDAVLFDYADILCWSDAGDLKAITWTGWGRTHVYPFIHPDNLLDLNGSYVEDGDRIGQRGALRLAKAMWYMLARLSGWDPAIPAGATSGFLVEAASESSNPQSSVLQPVASESATSKQEFGTL